MHYKYFFLTLGSLGLFALTVAGCGGSSATAPTATRSPATAQDPAPLELQAAWVTALGGTGEQVRLTLSGTGYVIVRGPNRASGAIAVRGDRIEFSQSTLCSGTGAYRWSLQGDSLLFTTLESEPCPGRGEVLNGQTYNRG